jgi:hypothetical protein
MRITSIHHPNHPLYSKINTSIDELLIDGPFNRRDTTQPSSRFTCCQFLLRKMQHRIPPILPSGTVPGYNRQLDRIFMPAPRLFLNGELYYSTLFHEIVHSTGHPSRLNRPELMNWIAPEDANYCREELIAEHGAAYLCAFAGIAAETLHHSSCYIQAYLDLLPADQTCLPQLRAKARDAIVYLLKPADPPATSNSKKARSGGPS